ncbi:MAG: hypothetical protein M3Z37_03345 [Candidatus Eremiobacteraeota bacterium]|nr:hypothetical protein [Candidatus Eremiobacteraeota bacterium]
MAVGTGTTPAPPGITPQKVGLRGVLGMLFVSYCLMAVIVLAILMLFFLRPYHAIKGHAALFEAATNCASVTASAKLPGPCSVEWGNVTRRYERSQSRRSGYRYYLDVRGGYGDQRTIELRDIETWWRTPNGSAIELQHWGDLVTAVQVPGGPSSPTSANPDWQLHNAQRGIWTLSIISAFLGALRRRQRHAAASAARGPGSFLAGRQHDATVDSAPQTAKS